MKNIFSSQKYDKINDQNRSQNKTWKNNKLNYIMWGCIYIMNIFYRKNNA